MHTFIINLLHTYLLNYISIYTYKYEYNYVKEAIKDPDKVVIVSTSPSVRAALGEEFGMPDGSFVQGKMVALLRKLGVNFVLDTNFAADLTIMEEASELIERVTKNTAPLPQFTSCCPAWIKYVETYYPEMIPNLSTAKSPIGMQGPTIKTFFAKKKGINPENIVNVALTPCTAKKFEIRRNEMNAAAKYLGIDDMRDMDYVITTREPAKWAKEENIDFASLLDSDYDDFMGEASGAAVIFGNTGGVMEAAMRTAYKLITDKEPPPYALTHLEDVRGMDGVKEATVQLGDDVTLSVAVVHGGKNTRDFLNALKENGKHYDFIEVMACPGGCIGGGGQPRTKLPQAVKTKEARIGGLYEADENYKWVASYENEEIQALYKDFLGEPLGHKAHELLHTHYTDRSAVLGTRKDVTPETCPTSPKFKG